MALRISDAYAGTPSAVGCSFESSAPTAGGRRSGAGEPPNDLMGSRRVAIWEARVPPRLLQLHGRVPGGEPASLGAILGVHMLRFTPG